MSVGYNHFGKLDAFFHSPGVAGEARVKTEDRKEVVFESSLLLYAGWSSAKYKYQMTESDSACMLMISSKKGELKFERREQIVAALSATINHKYKDEAVFQKRIPPQVIPGQVFLLGNNNDEDFLVDGSWEDNVLCIVGGEALFVFLFKTYSGRMQLGLPIDQFWLNRVLLQRDGKSPFAPVKQ